MQQQQKSVPFSTGSLVCLRWFPLFQVSEVGILELLVTKTFSFFSGASLCELDEGGFMFTDEIGESGL